MLKRFFSGLFFAVVLTMTASAALAGGDDAPAWLQQAASATTPTYNKNVPVVVLHDESTMTVKEDGTVTTVSTYAIRILTREGRGAAVAAAGYETDTGKVKDLRAWLIRPSGQVKSYGKDAIIDEAGAMNDIYNESRIRKIVAGDDAEAGAVFGYQATTEEKRGFFNQSIWYFQERYPVLSSRITMTLPAEWKATSVTFNHEKVEPTVSGSAYTWELTNLPPIEPEPASPAWTNLAPRLAINYFPPSGTSSNGAKVFSKWSEVSSWYSALSDSQSAPDDALAAKARELTANAKTEFERIQAIGRYVQNLQYISIQLGVGRYRPHAATEVFAKSYGDCKDKANLMRAMLKAVKIESYLVLIYSDDPTYVREEWASPNQFNHCIIAIKVNDETKAPTVVQHPTLGRLLIFDATDDDTPVGDLPDQEQGSFALVAAGENGTLLRMPTTPPEANLLERQTEANLSPDGSITATIRERAVGQSAVSFRREFHHLARPEYTKIIEGWVTRGASGAKVSKVEPADSSADASFALNVEFSADGYAQLMQNRLLVFKPAIVARRESLFLTESSRKHPVVLEPHAYTETVRVKLPAGFDVDEMPDPLKLEMPFGNYTTSYKVADGQLIFTRTLTVRSATIPVDQYSTVRSFFERIRAAEQSPVVLAKK